MFASPYVLKIRIILDFSTFLIYYCVKDQQFLLKEEKMKHYLKKKRTAILVLTAGMIFTGCGKSGVDASTSAADMVEEDTTVADPTLPDYKDGTLTMGFTEVYAMPGDKVSLSDLGVEADGDYEKFGITQVIHKGGVETYDYTDEISFKEEGRYLVYIGMVDKSDNKKTDHVMLNISSGADEEVNVVSTKPAKEETRLENKTESDNEKSTESTKSGSQSSLENKPSNGSSGKESSVVGSKPGTGSSSSNGNGSKPSGSTSSGTNTGSKPSGNTGSGSSSKPSGNTGSSSKPSGNTGSGSVTPTQPAPTQPAPTQPAPTEPETPAPTEPAPTEPETPAPTEPAPTEPETPAPTEPETPAPTEPAPPANPADQYSSSLAYELLDLVNAERANAGLPALSWNGGLDNGALIRARELNVSFSHTRPDGSGSSSAYGMGVGEIIASGCGSASSAVSAWMASDGHRASILGDVATSMSAARSGNNWVIAFR